MEIAHFMEILFIVVYAAILGLVTPYIIGRSEQYGALVPATIGLALGSVLWVALVWVGLKSTDGWIWIIVMLAMPAALVVGARFLKKRRDAADEAELLQLKHGVAAKPAKTEEVQYVN